jgi:UDP-N-acetylmuramoyl-tripeptide--D-alanyl-D-alanine ligase
MTASSGMPEEAVIPGLSHDGIANDILRHAVEGDFVLLKGSRGMKMDRVAEAIRDSFRS